MDGEITQEIEAKRAEVQAMINGPSIMEQLLGKLRKHGVENLHYPTLEQELQRGIRNQKFILQNEEFISHALDALKKLDHTSDYEDLYQQGLLLLRQQWGPGNTEKVRHLIFPQEDLCQQKH